MSSASVIHLLLKQHKISEQNYAPKKSRAVLAMGIIWYIIHHWALGQIYAIHAALNSLRRCKMQSMGQDRIYQKQTTPLLKSVNL